MEKYTSSVMIIIIPFFLAELRLLTFSEYSTKYSTIAIMAPLPCWNVLIWWEDDSQTWEQDCLLVQSGNPTLSHWQSIPKMMIYLANICTKFHSSREWYELMKPLIFWRARQVPTVEGSVKSSTMGSTMVPPTTTNPNCTIGLTSHGIRQRRVYFQSVCNE